MGNGKLIAPDIQGQRAPQRNLWEGRSHDESVVERGSKATKTSGRDGGRRCASPCYDSIAQAHPRCAWALPDRCSQHLFGRGRGAYYPQLSHYWQLKLQTATPFLNRFTGNAAYTQMGCAALLPQRAPPRETPQAEAVFGDSGRVASPSQASRPLSI